MSNTLFRPIQREDLDEVFELLQQLTPIDYSDRSKDECWKSYNNNNSSNSIVGVVNNKIVAYGSVVIESKIRGEHAGHIEDIVVSSDVRMMGVGIDLIKHLISIAQSKKCYRVTLMCDQGLTGFYAKNGFQVNNVSMKKFLV